MAIPSFDFTAGILAQLCRNRSCGIRLKSQVLFVHHVSDSCPSAPYADTAWISGNYPLISLSGGLDASPNECQHLGPHGFYGKESETVEHIVNWMLKKPFTKEID